MPAEQKTERWGGAACKGLVLLVLCGLLVGFTLSGQTIKAWDFVMVQGSRELLAKRASSPVTLRRRVGLPPPRAPVAAPPAPSCNLPVEQSPFGGSCTLLRDVCLDQGRIILYERKYQPQHGNGPPVDLPDLTPSGRQRAFYLAYRNKNGADLKFGLPPIPVRTASQAEPRRYLADPAFSTCTVPVVYYQHNSFNFAHTFRDNAALFYSALQETPWAAHAKVLLMTGGGLLVSSMNRALWQPVTNLSVDSVAEASVRLDDNQVGQPPRSPGPRPPSYEGTEQRCFRHLYVCLHALATEKWQLHAYGQLLVRHYGGPQLVRNVKETAAEEQVLRIIFQKRGGEDRQIVNADELMAACNRWRFVTPGGTPVRAQCWQVELSSLQVGIAAAQQADIFVGVHGANIANAWLMRPGSSVVELTMHEFEDSTAHINLARRNNLDRDTQVQFWKLLLCDPKGSWTPGWSEKLSLKMGATEFNPAWPKYRNVVVRWEALLTVLQAVVESGGSMDDYRQRYVEGRWWWLSTAKRTVFAGPNQDMTCKLGRRMGLIN